MGFKRSIDQGAAPAARPVEASTSRDPAAPLRPPLSALVQHAASEPSALSRADAIQLQRTLGNAAVAQLLGKAKPRENRTGLPDRLKAGVEALSGLALDDVRVHYSSPQPAQVQALATTQGTDIHIARGQEQHLPHEAWHVVQQKQGRVKPTLQLKGVAINDDDRLERDADAMGAAAMQGGTASAALSGWRARTDASAGLPSSHATIQRVDIVVAMPDVKVAQAAAPDFLSGAGLPADMGVVNRAKALAKSKGTVLVPIEEAKLDGLGNNDTLHVYGHGSGSATGGRMAYSAQQLAGVMQQRGLQAGKAIVLVGCGSGASYLKEVEKALRDAGIPCRTISAAMDDTTTDIHGQNYVLSSEAKMNIITAQLGIKPPYQFDPLDQERHREELQKAKADVLSKATVPSAIKGVPQSVSPRLLVPLTPASNLVQVITNGVKKIQEPPDFLTG